MQKNTIKTASLLFLTLFFFLTACENAESLTDASKDSPASGPEDTEITSAETAETAAETEAEKVTAKNSSAATVNGVIISRTDFDNTLKVAQQQFASIGAKKGSVPDTVNIEEEVIERLIGIELMLQDAQKRGIAVEAAVVEGEMTAFRNSFKTEEEFTEYLKKEDLTTATAKDIIAKQMVLQMLQRALLKEMKEKSVVTPEQSKAFYDGNLEKFQHPEQIQASHILITVAKDADEETAKQALKTIEEVRKKAIDGEDFAELAKKNSQGPSNVRGGDLGFFSKGQMVPPFEEAAFALQPDEISEVVKTDFGYHIIKLTGKKAAGVTPFAEVESQINQYLSQILLEQNQKKYTKDLREKAEVEVNI